LTSGQRIVCVQSPSSKFRIGWRARRLNALRLRATFDSLRSLRAGSSPRKRGEGWSLALSGRRTATRTPKAFRAPRSGAENVAQGASPGAAGTPHELAAERRKKNVHSLRQPAPSFAAPRLILIALAGPTACAVGYILMPLRGECLRDASSESLAARSGAS